MKRKRDDLLDGFEEELKKRRLSENESERESSEESPDNINETFNDSESSDSECAEQAKESNEASAGLEKTLQSEKSKEESNVSENSSDPESLDEALENRLEEIREIINQENSNEPSASNRYTELEINEILRNIRRNKFTDEEIDEIGELIRTKALIKNLRKNENSNSLMRKLKELNIPVNALIEALVAYSLARTSPGTFVALRSNRIITDTLKSFLNPNVSTGVGLTILFLQLMGKSPGDYCSEMSLEYFQNHKENFLVAAPLFALLYETKSSLRKHFSSLLETGTELRDIMWGFKAQ